jgi:hypothetical protein
VLSFGYLSLHEQRKVTRCRAASGIKAVKASPQAIPIQALDSGFRRNDGRRVSPQAIPFKPWIPAFAGTGSGFRLPPE